MIAADLRPGDRFRPDSHRGCECGRVEPLHTAHTAPRRDGVNPGLVHLRLSVEGVDDGAPYDATFIAAAVLIPA